MVHRKQKYIQVHMYREARIQHAPTLAPASENSPALVPVITHTDALVPAIAHALFTGHCCYQP